MAWCPAPLRVLAVAVAVAAAISLPAAGAEAKELVKVTCEEDPGELTFGGESDPLPADCDFSEGVTLMVTDVEGTELGACTTNEGGRCNVPITGEADDPILIYEDLDTSVPGFAPRDQPLQSVVGATEFNAVAFVNLPATTELPDTGVGTAATGA